MNGWATACTGSLTEDYGSDVLALGDVSNDDIADFAVERRRCDTASEGRNPIEAYVYHGIRGGLPDPKNGQRIGPREVFSETRILCSGDWDADGNRDLVARMRVFDDTTEADTIEGGLGTYRVCVFWGNFRGEFSIDDTTHLVVYNDVWLAPYRAVSIDLNGDSVDDLAVWGHSSLKAGMVIKTARLHFYTGTRNGRWGRNGLQRTSELAWWNVPPLNFLTITDHDCDGYPDIALINERRGGGEWSTVSVVYGRAGMLPDTLSTETADLTLANGHATLFADVTGDRIPELIVNCGSQEVLKVFAGKQGQRLRTMVSTGNEPGKPWLVVDLPKKINWTDWFSSGFEPLYDLGDVDLDGISDIALYNFPFFSIYTTGIFFDQYIDGGMWWGGVTTATRLGDIDGSGRASFCVHWPGKPGGIAFYRATDTMHHFGEFVDLPHAEGYRCENAAAAGDPLTPLPARSEEPDLALDVVPNPSRGEMTVTWRTGSTITGNAVLSLVDASGAELVRRVVPAEPMKATINTAGVPRGFYLLVLSHGKQSSAVRILIE